MSHLPFSSATFCPSQGLPACSPCTQDTTSCDPGRRGRFPCRPLLQLSSGVCGGAGGEGGRGGFSQAADSSVAPRGFWTSVLQSWCLWSASSVLRLPASLRFLCGPVTLPLPQELRRVSSPLFSPCDSGLSLLSRSSLRSRSPQQLCRVLQQKLSSVSAVLAIFVCYCVYYHQNPFKECYNRIATREESEVERFKVHTWDYTCE